MKTHLLVKTIAIFALMCLFVSAAAAAGGSGTAGDPYRIETPAELQAMNTHLAAYYAMQNDIDLTGVTWTPVGNETSPFTGSLEGNGYTISDLSMIDQVGIDRFGLFDTVESGCYLANFTVSNFEISGDYNDGGALIVGYTNNHDFRSLTDDIIIYNVDALNCYINSEDYGTIGTILGYAYMHQNNIEISYCDIDNCNFYSYGDFGGIVGWFGVGRTPSGLNSSSMYIEYCNVTNSVITARAYAGGIVSYFSGYGSDILDNNIEIRDCYVYSTSISTNSECGGIVGMVDVGADVPVSFINCYIDTCDIYSEYAVAGGIAGEVYISSFGDTGLTPSSISDNCVVINSKISTDSDWGGEAVGGIYGTCYIARPINTIIQNSYVGNCEITTMPLTDTSDGYASGFVGIIYNDYVVATGNLIVDSFIQNTAIDGYSAKEFSIVLDRYDNVLPLVTSNVFGSGNILNGYYHAELDTDLYLVEVTEDTDYFYITITPPDALAYNVSKNLFYTEASYDLIGSTWTTQTGEYSYSIQKTYGTVTATAGYLAIYRDGYSDYVYWGFPLGTYPIIIEEIDVPATGNLEEAVSLSASAYNIESYQWQQSLNGATWTNIDGPWTPTTNGVNYIRLKTTSEDFTVYSGTAAITIVPPKPIVSFYAATPVSIAKDGSVTFVGSITLSGSDTLTSYIWLFGDGSTDSSSLAPTHKYTTAGTYTVSLAAISSYGTTTYSRTNYISVSTQAEYVKFDNETYTSGDTATVSWNMANTNFVDHVYTIRIFAIDDLGQAYEELTPVEISSASGEQEFSTDLWAGGYMVYIYQDSYIFLEPTSSSTVISMHDLNLLITNSGVTWENYTLLTISDGVSTIAEGNTSTGSITFTLQTGTYTITATTDGQTAISTTIDLISDDVITFDWVTGASKGTTTGSGSSYASTFVTFRVMDSTYGLPISGVKISTRGVAATNPFEWFANLFGTAWGATILGTEQSGITDDSGVITFAMFPGVRYVLNISYAVLDEPITQTFTPSSLSTEYPIYLDVIDDADPEADTSVTTLVSADVDGLVLVTYSDTSLTTTSIQMKIYEKGLDGNYTLIESASAYGNASTRSFQLTDFAGTSIKIIITAETGEFGTIERVYYHTFPGPMIALGGLPASCYIWICLISAVILAGVATFVSSYATCFIICFVEWIYWFFGWFFEIGTIPSATLLTIATVMSVAIYIGSRR